MTVERFTLDTNVLVYYLDRSDRARQAVAIEILHRSVRATCVLTLQSLSEFYAAVTRKVIVDAQTAADQAEDWLIQFPTITASAACVRAALATVAKRPASYWDALLLATAAHGGCTAIITEDMADGDIVNGVRIVHPFRPGGLTEAATRLLRPS